MLSEAKIVGCLQSADCTGVVRMSFESGPYCIDRPTIKASRFAEQIESAACAERDARIAELEAANEAFGKRQEWWNARMLELEQQLAEARKDAMHAAALICDHLDAEVDKYPAACAKAIREAAGVEVASQSDRMVLVPFSIDDCDEIVEAACNAGNLYRVDFIRAWQAAIRAAIKEQT